MTDNGFPQVDGYRITRAVGQGGMSTVYLAEQVSLGRDIHHHRVQQHFHVQAQHLLNKVLGVAGSRQIFFQQFQSKTIVDALLQDAAQFRIPFQQHHFFRTILFCTGGSRQPCRAAANHHNVTSCFLHLTATSQCPGSFSINIGEEPVSFAI